MAQVIITATNTGMTKTADIISKNPTKLIVVIENTVIRLVLTKPHNSKKYIGKLHGVEFSCVVK